MRARAYATAHNTHTTRNAPRTRVSMCWRPERAAMKRTPANAGPSIEHRRASPAGTLAVAFATRDAEKHSRGEKGVARTHTSNNTQTRSCVHTPKSHQFTSHHIDITLRQNAPECLPQRRARERLCASVREPFDPTDICTQHVTARNA